MGAAVNKFTMERPREMVIEGNEFSLERSRSGEFECRLESAQFTSSEQEHGELVTNLTPTFFLFC